MKDPIRPGVSKAVSYARDKAGIGIKLVSGDHKYTA
jgi:magnesium-transporting ATPase (P-type)